MKVALGHLVSAAEACGAALAPLVSLQEQSRRLPFASSSFLKAMTALSRLLGDANRVSDFFATAAHTTQRLAPRFSGSLQLSRLLGCLAVGFATACTQSESSEETPTPDPNLTLKEWLSVSADIAYTCDPTICGAMGLYPDIPTTTDDGAPVSYENASEALVSLYARYAECEKGQTTEPTSVRFPAQQVLFTVNNSEGTMTVSSQAEAIGEERCTTETVTSNMGTFTFTRHEINLDIPIVMTGSMLVSVLDGTIPLGLIPVNCQATGVFQASGLLGVVHGGENDGKTVLQFSGVTQALQGSCGDPVSQSLAAVKRIQNILLNSTAQITWTLDAPSSSSMLE